MKKDKKNREKESQKEEVMKKSCEEKQENKTAEEPAETTEKELSKEELLEQEIASLKDKHMRLSAEYDNYRKRTMKEKADLLLNGGERTLKDLLPIIDDLDLAIKNISDASDINSLKEGVDLIFSKFNSFLLRNGVKEMEPIGKPFNEEEQQAIAMIPAPSKEQKGIVIDCTKKGYTLNEKVLRFADVVVGE